MQNNDQCNVCGRDKVSDYPECHIIQADYPELIEMENVGVKKSITSAFQAVQQFRCQFMGWLIKSKLAVPDGELYKLPDELSLRPQAMAEMEQEIIQRGAAIANQNLPYAPIKELNEVISGYVKRASAYFETAYQTYRTPDIEAF